MDIQLDNLIKRIDALETQLAFQDDTIDALELLVREQNEELQTMQRYIRLLAEKIKPAEEQDNNEPFNPVDERPPHY